MENNWEQFVTEEDLQLQNKIDQLSLDWNNFKSSTSHTNDEIDDAEMPQWARHSQPEQPHSHVQLQQPAVSHPPRPMRPEPPVKLSLEEKLR